MNDRGKAAARDDACVAASEDTRASFAPSLFTFFSDTNDAEALASYAKTNLPASATKAVEKTIDEIGFRAAFKKRLMPELKSWIGKPTM